MRDINFERFLVIHVGNGNAAYLVDAKVQAQAEALAGESASTQSKKANVRWLLVSLRTRADEFRTSISARRNNQSEREEQEFRQLRPAEADPSA